LNLTDYVYAYGNSISDPAYAPFTIDVLAAAEIQVSDSLTHEALRSMQSAESVNKEFNPFERPIRRTSVDKAGIYTYYESGDYSMYSAYEYTGHQ
jgi:hypothetical protein